MATYDNGDVIEITALFENAAGTDVDPSAVSFKVQPPNGAAVVTYVYGTDSEVTKSATGIYVLTLQPTVVGRWYYRAIGTGSNKAAEESSFDIRESYFD